MAGLFISITYSFSFELLLPAWFAFALFIWHWQREHPWDRGVLITVLWGVLVFITCLLENVRPGFAHFAICELIYLTFIVAFIALAVWRLIKIRGKMRLWMWSAALGLIFAVSPILAPYLGELLTDREFISQIALYDHVIKEIDQKKGPFADRDPAVILRREDFDWPSNVLAVKIVTGVASQRSVEFLISSGVGMHVGYLNYRAPRQIIAKATPEWVDFHYDVRHIVGNWYKFAD